MEGLEGTVVDASADVSTEAPADTGASTETSGAETAASAVAKYKYRRGGEEREATAEELAAMLSDDYEHEFRGPQGKPVKANWQTLERHVQLSSGAQEAIRQARMARDALQQERELGKKDIPTYLQRHLGIEDPETFFLEQARKRFQEESEIANLMATDPMAATAKLRERERARAQAQANWEKQAREAEAQKQQAQARHQQMDAEMQAQMKAAGISVNRTNLQRAQQIFQHHLREMDITLPFDQVAALLRQEIEKEALSYFDSHSDVLKLLGDKRRALLREKEMAAVKQAKKEAASSAPKPKVEAAPSTKRSSAPADIDSLKSVWR